MVPERQKVRTDGRTDGIDGQTDDAKTISLRLHRGIINVYTFVLNAYMTRNPTENMVFVK